MGLERRGFGERPAGKSLRPVEERPRDAEREACAPLLEGRPELPGIAQALRRQLDNPAPAQAYRVAAIEATADRDVGHRQPTLGDRRRLPGGERRRAHAGLRQAEAMAAAEQSAPGTARAEDGLRANAAMLGEDTRDPAGLPLEAARGPNLVQRPTP